MKNSQQITIESDELLKVKANDIKDDVLNGDFSIDRSKTAPQTP